MKIIREISPKDTSVTVIYCLQMYGDNQNYNGQVPPGPPGSDNMNPFMTSPNMPPLLSK